MGIHQGSACRQGPEDGVLLVEDSYNGTKILKVDEDGKPLGGAKLQIEDGKGYVIAKWTSYSTGPVQITDLRPNVHYFLVETKAPSGYKKASTIEFYVKTAAPGPETTPTRHCGQPSRQPPWQARPAP